MEQRVTSAVGTPLEEARIQEFESGLRGRLLRPGGDGYDEARRVWNAMIDKRPALIARCAGVSDVISSVNFARTNDLLVSIKGGGHSVAGTAVCEGGLMIDLSAMRSVRVDPLGRRLRAEPGCTWGDIDVESQAFGLAVTGGQISDTGIAGLTLGGGLGWLARNFGLSCDNLLSIDMVTADGRFLTANATENADLFWAVRGGGGNFGVVTSFEYALHPLGQVLGGFITYPVASAREVLQFFREFARNMPDELTIATGFITTPDGVPVVVLAPCYSGPLEEGQRVLRPLREFGQPLADMIGPMSYVKVQTSGDAMSPPGRRYYMRSNFMSDPSDEAIDTLIEHFATVPSPYTVEFLLRLGGAIGRVGKDDTSFYHRDANYNFVTITSWTDPDDDQANIRWARGLWQDMQPFVTRGVYVNELGEEDADRVKAAYGPTTYLRLAALKKQYDPTNFFRLNPNITPAE